MKTTKLKQFIGTKMYKGIQYEVTLCATSVAAAAKAIETTPYTIKEYFSVVEPREEICKAYPNDVFAWFDSGLLGCAYPRERGRAHLQTHEQVKSKIDKLRANPELVKKLGY